MDTLKTRLQSPDYQKIYYDASRNSINRKLLFRGLYQGAGSVILITIPSSGAFFTTYEGAKLLLAQANPILNGYSSPLIPQPIIHSAASALAELVSCFILTPAEVLKQNAQMIRWRAGSSYSKLPTTFHQPATLQALQQFRRPTQLWRGYSALVARNLPFTALQFPMFEHLKAGIRSYKKSHGTLTGATSETYVITAISAGSAGSVAAVLTTPVDVVKTRIMLAASVEISREQTKKETDKERSGCQSAKASASEKGVKKGGLAVARDIFQENGLKGLFRGGLLRAVWTALGSGLYLAAYDSARVWLGDRHE